MPTLKISKKVPLAIVIASILATVVTGALSYRKAAIELQGEAEKKLTALGGAKTHFIRSYLDSIRQDLKVQSDSPLIQRGPRTPEEVHHRQSEPHRRQTFARRRAGRVKLRLRP